MNRLHINNLNTTKKLEHSAKGSVWDDHKYIQRVDGTYYYPDSYEGGRHISDLRGSKIDSNEEDDKAKETKLEKWEEEMYKSIDSTLSRGTGLFGIKDPSELASDDYQDFRKTLSEFAGIDASKLSREEVERMRKKFINHYDKNSSDKIELQDSDVEKLANEVIRGNFGNGQTRKELLGDNYQEVQDKVNELLKGKIGTASAAKTTSDAETSKKVDDEVKNAVEKVTGASKGLDLDQVYSVYRGGKRKGGK